MRITTALGALLALLTANAAVARHSPFGTYNLAGLSQCPHRPLANKCSCPVGSSVRAVRMLCRLLVCAFGALASSAVAHHGPGRFDFSAPVVIEGMIVEVDWRNPHVYLTIETRGPNGELLERDLEAANISTLRTLGLEREMLPPGAAVTVRAFPGRGAGRLMGGATITLSDGRVYALTNGRADAAPLPAGPPAEGLAGRWAPVPGGQRALAEASRTFPLSEAGRASRGAPPIPTPTEAVSVCQTEAPFAAPIEALAVGSFLRTIDIDNEKTVLRYDGFWGRPVERVVHLDQTEHLADAALSAHGHSIGRWEGATLVIDTVAFAPMPAQGIWPEGSSALHITERLTLTEDRRRLRYEITREDPEIFTEPVTFSTEWDHRPDLEHSAEACDPENARRFLAEEQ